MPPRPVRPRVPALEPGRGHHPIAPVPVALRARGSRRRGILRSVPHPAASPQGQRNGRRGHDRSAGLRRLRRGDCRELRQYRLRLAERCDAPAQTVDRCRNALVEPAAFVRAPCAGPDPAADRDRRVAIGGEHDARAAGRLGRRCRARQSERLSRRPAGLRADAGCAVGGVRDHPGAGRTRPAPGPRRGTGRADGAAGGGVRPSPADAASDGGQAGEPAWASPGGPRHGRPDVARPAARPDRRSDHVRLSAGMDIGDRAGFRR